MVGIVILPFIKTDGFMTGLQFLVAMGAGSLFGTAVMILIPHVSIIFRIPFFYLLVFRLVCDKQLFYFLNFATLSSFSVIFKMQSHGVGWILKMDEQIF